MTDDNLPVEPGTGPWTAGRLTRVGCYHTDPECSALEAGGCVKPASENAIEWHDLAECEMCAGTREPGDGGNPPVLVPDGGDQQ